MTPRTTSRNESAATRRSALKGLGLGLVGGRLLPADTAAAQRLRTQSDLQVGNVEVGHVTLTGNWEKKHEVENNTSDGYFDVRFEVDGCDTSSDEVQLAYNAAAISTSEDEIVDVQGDTFSEETTSNSVTVLHGSRVKHAFRTGVPGLEWSDGRYEVQIAVADINQQAYAGGVSQSFTIR